MSSNDGATPERTDIPSAEGERLAECMGRWKHSMQWVWKEGGTSWTDFRRCTTCGKIFNKDGREVEAT